MTKDKLENNGGSPDTASITPEEPKKGLIYKIRCKIFGEEMVRRGDEAWKIREIGRERGFTMNEMEIYEMGPKKAAAKIVTGLLDLDEKLIGNAKNAYNQFAETIDMEKTDKEIIKFCIKLASEENGDYALKILKIFDFEDMAREFIDEEIEKGHDKQVIALTELLGNAEKAKAIRKSHLKIVK